MTKKYPNIRARLVSGLLVLIVLLLSISLFYVNDVQKLNRTIDEIIKHPYAVSNGMRDINIYINAMHRSMKDVTLSENETQLKEAISNVDAYEKLVYDKFDMVSKRFLGNPNDLANTYEAFLNWKPIRDQVIDFVKNNNLEAAIAITKNEGANYVEMLINKTQTMIVFADSKTNEYNIHSLEIQKNADRKSIIFIILSLVLGFATFVWIIAGVDRPLEKIIQQIRKIPSEQFINKFPENETNKLALLDFVFLELEDQKKHLEVQVNERTKELIEAKNLIKNAIDNASIGMTMLNLDGIIIDANQAFCKYIGYSKEELVKMKFNDFTHEQDKERGLEIFKKIVGEGAKDVLFEKNYIHKSGEIIQGSVTGSLVKDSMNKPIFVFTQIKDITQQKKHEIESTESKKELENKVKSRTKELEEKTNKLIKSQKALTYLLEDVNESQGKMKYLNEQIAETNKELEAFSYSVSHDLKAPLRAITGFSQILNEDYSAELSPGAKRYLGLIHNNAENMGALINDLISFSRLGRKALQISKLNMHDIVARVKKEIKLEIRDRELSFKVLEMPSIHADESLIFHVMINLISNAVKFSSKVGKAEIEIGCKSKNNESVFYVKDNGVGFDMRYADKIFDVFQRLHSGEEFPGTGIGLSIVHRIIHKHNGKIWVQSEKNKGTTFYFTI